MEQYQESTTTDIFWPVFAILDAMPEQCRTDPGVAAEADRLAFWVNDGRLTADKAARLILTTTVER